MFNSFLLYALALIAAFIIVAFMFYKEGWHRGHKAGYDLRKTLDHAHMYGMKLGKTRHYVRANPDGTHSHIYEED